jgi:P pilus assembly chaperone PapD
VKVFKNSTGNDAGFTAYDASTNSILVNFRGTLPWLIKNWIQDIDFVTQDYEYCNYQCKVHR